MKIIVITSLILFLFLIKEIFRKKNQKNKIIHIDDDLCARCGICERKCRHSVLKMVNDENGFHVKIQNPENCTACGDCVHTCKFHALSLMDKTI